MDPNLYENTLWIMNRGWVIYIGKTRGLITKGSRDQITDELLDRDGLLDKRLVVMNI